MLHTTLPRKCRVSQSSLMALALCLTVSLAHADTPPSFEAQHAAALAQNPPGVSCALQTEDGKTRFQMGELIHVTASFAATTAGYMLSPYYQSRPSALSFGTFTVSPRDGVVDPLGTLPPEQFIMINGYVPDPVTLSNKPYKMTVLLNEWLRFDQSGHYRCYLTTHKVSASKPGAKTGSSPFDNKATAPVASNILELDIESPAPGWAAAQARQALAKLNGPAGKQLFPEQGWGHPAEVLRYLATREAAQAMIERMGQDTRPRSSPVESWDYRQGLIGFPERSWAIAQMQQALARPDYPVTQTFLETLALLRALQVTPSPADEGPTLIVPRPEPAAWPAPALPETAKKAQQQQVKDWTQHLYGTQNKFLNSSWHDADDALARKTGYARAMTLHSLLELSWGALGEDAKAQARVPQLISLLAPVLDQLPPTPLDYFLGDEWRRIHSHAMLPALQRLWANPKAIGEFKREVPDLILRRIYELDPQVGRQLILAEIRRPQPRVGAAALSILPEASIPALDQTFSNKLRAGQDDNNLDVTCPLIARYASPALLRQAQQFYEPQVDTMSCAPQAALLAYFLRVDPPYGLRMVKRALAARKQTGCYQSVLTLVASTRMTPALEALAIATLQDPAPDVVAEAAEVLKEHGSPAAQVPLMARLKQESVTLKPNARIESALSGALAQAQHWRLDATALSEVRALCHDANTRNNLDFSILSRSEAKVHLDYSLDFYNSWGVGNYHGMGWASFTNKLQQFPRGTVFSWQTMSYGKEADALFARVQALAIAHGMKVEREPKINW